MQNAFAHCGELVRKLDRDRYLTALFAPALHRDALFALYAFNVEVGRVRDAAREALPGEIRLQWWRDVLGGERAGEGNANPVVAALLRTIARYGLASDALIEIVDARRFDLYDEPMPGIADLEAYATRTAATVFGLAAQILGVDAAPAAEPAGIAYGITALMRAFPVHAARRQLYVPAELLKRHGVPLHDIFAGKSSGGLNAACAELRGLARHHLALAHNRLAAVSREAIPAFLAVSPVRSSLDRLDRCDAFAPAEISPWRRQWLIWRAARNPARIAG